MELKNKKVLITGGSAGIGKAIVKELVRHGVKDIAVVGRKKEHLEALLLYRLMFQWLKT